VEDFNGKTAIFKMVWFRFYSTSIIFDTVEDFNGTTAVSSMQHPGTGENLDWKYLFSFWFRFYSTSIIFGTVEK
jgi:hypothetical protein